MVSVVLAATASAQVVNQGITQNANQFAGATGGANINQNINQRANQLAFGHNNTTANQTLNQNARQIAIGAGNVGQNIGQTGTQFAAGGNANQNISQNLNQNANQTAISNVRNYYTVSQKSELTTEERTVINSRAENFLVLYPQYRAFIMPIYDFQTIVTQGIGNVIVLDVSPSGTAIIPVGYGNVVRIPLANLANNIASIPIGSTVAVISDNDINSAVAMTLLRMYGYNAWILPVGVCDTQGIAYGVPATYSTPYTGTAVSSSLTSQSQTVGGVTTGQTTGAYSSTNY